jgi:hypothetical protein
LGRCDGPAPARLFPSPLGMNDLATHRDVRNADELDPFDMTDDCDTHIGKTTAACIASIPYVVGDLRVRAD